MMKKMFLLTFIVSIFLIINGCDSLNQTSIDKEKIEVPFLFYEIDSSKGIVNAKLAKWDLNAGLIDSKDKPLYSFKDTTPADDGEPIVWDGTNFVLRDNVNIENLEEEKVEIVSDDGILEFGGNIRLKQVYNDDGDIVEHRLTLNTQDGVKEKKALLLHDTIKDTHGNEFIIGEDRAWIEFNKETGEVLHICVDRITNSYLYIGKTNIESIEKTNWNKISLPDYMQAGGNYSPCHNNSQLVGNKYYIQSFYSETNSAGLGVVDIDTGKTQLLDELVSECREIVEEGSFEPLFPKDIRPIGSYKDVLIVSVPISTDTHAEYLMCAIKDNIFVGALHLKANQPWEIINSKKEVTSTFDVTNKNLLPRFSEYLSFPSSNRRYYGRYKH